MMGRRAFVSSVAGGFVVWPLAAHAQRQGLPVIGYLANASAAAFTNYVDAFRRGLVETGYVEGQNVAIEYRWTEGRRDRARNVGDLDHVFETIIQTHAGALFVSDDPLFTGARTH